MISFRGTLSRLCPFLLRVLFSSLHRTALVFEFSVSGAAKATATASAATAAATAAEDAAVAALAFTESTPVPSG